MRFSLGHLLLIFPAFVLGMFVVMACQLSVRDHPLHLSTVVETQMLRSQIAMVDESRGAGRISEGIVNQWLAGRLPANHPAADDFYDCADPDRWCNPYQCVRNMELPDGQIVSLGVYSRGRDGVSLSQGSDPDDINSWDIETGRYYVREFNLRHRLTRVIGGALITPFTYVGLLGCIRFVSFLWKEATAQSNRLSRRQ